MDLMAPKKHTMKNMAAASAVSSRDPPTRATIPDFHAGACMSRFPRSMMLMLMRSLIGIALSLVYFCLCFKYSTV